MSDKTNMDLNSEKKKDGPNLEFSLPLNEVDEDLEVGQFGTVIIPVEVTEVSQTHVYFRKAGQADSGGAFRQEGLEDMERRINEKEDETDDED